MLAALPILVGAFVFGYVLGSIPFGLLLTRVAGTRDLRSIGSGNIGATNVLRTGRKGLAAATLLLDVLKGTAATWITFHWYGPEPALLAGFGAFTGHLFPVWLRFKGGKGVATYLGVLVAVSWIAVAVFAVMWLAVAALTRHASLASILAAPAASAALWFSGDTEALPVFAVMTVLLIGMHRGNIARLRSGTESRIGERLDAAGSA